ncbi:MAG: VWA domain-containing protein [Desulfobacteraceae bacterium]|nr:VWA domain-containing protein [Desulfobacteraceae bacterium]
MKLSSTHSIRAISLALGILFVLAWIESSRAMVPSRESEDKTLSPYFFVQSSDPDLDQLPLKSTSAAVNISGIIADVSVTQVYKNEGKKALEAVYVFPASTRAAVYGMKMTIGDRTIVAKIDKRAEARKAYEQAKAEGKSASLLEQQRPNVFRMNIANILPGDVITTELRYTELLVPTEGVYEFVYPTVVGPRYSNQPAAGASPSDTWTRNPYLHEGEPPRNTFDIKVNLASGVPIREMTCSTHKTNIHYRDKATAVVELDPADKYAGNRDYILKYRLTGDKIESGMLLFEGQKENYFLLMMQPPKRPSGEALPPREYVFIIDVSGSMNGYPLDITKKLFKDLAAGLRPGDFFNVLFFSGGSDVLAERSLPATPENLKRAVAMMESRRGSGGTELLPAIERMLRLPKTPGVSRSFIIATDGYVSVEPEVFDLMRKGLGDSNFFAFGIGTSVNRHLIEGMARIGAGEPFVITSASEAPAKAEKFRQYIQNPLLTQIKLDFGTFEAYDVEPSGVPDLFAQRPVMIFGKWKGKPQGKATLTGTSGKARFSTTVDISGVKALPENSALQYLWARSRIAQLSDYNNLQPNDARVAQITELGLNYSLLTAYTSFVAIDSEIRRKEGDLATVEQPLPLPEGVSDLAVGNAAQYRVMAAPAPGFARGAGGKSLARLPERTESGTKENLPAREKPSVAPSITVETLSVAGKPGKAMVREFFEAHRAELLACMGNAGTGSRKVQIKWTIDADGTVKNIVIPIAGLSKCWTELMSRWVFQPPQDGRKATVSMTVTITF